MQAHNSSLQPEVQLTSVDDLWCKENISDCAFTKPLSRSTMGNRNSNINGYIPEEA